MQIKSREKRLFLIAASIVKLSVTLSCRLRLGTVQVIKYLHTVRRALTRLSREITITISGIVRNNCRVEYVIERIAAPEGRNFSRQQL